MGRYADITEKNIEKNFNGEKLRIYRERAEITKSSFAKLVNNESLEGLSLTRTSIANYENGETNPFDTTVTYMAEVLKIDYKDLLR